MFSENWKGRNTPLTLWLWRLTLPPGKVVPPIFFFMKMTAKDVKEITYYMPLVTFFSVLERPEKTVRGLQQPPLVRRGLKGLLLKAAYIGRNPSLSNSHRTFICNFRTPSSGLDSNAGDRTLTASWNDSLSETLTDQANENHM